MPAANSPPRDYNITIGLLWHAVDSGNHGVNALTISNLAIAKDAATQLGLKACFILFSLGHKDDPATTPDGHRIVRINRQTILTSAIFWKALGELDCMLDISAGDSFAEIYGPKRFFWMWLTKRLTILRGVPLVLSPQTIGPFSRQPYLRLAAGVMKRARLTIARDPMSLAAMRAMAPMARGMLAADVAFRLPYAPRPRVDDGKIHVGVNVSGLLWQQSISGGNAYKLPYDYAVLTRILLDALVAREDITVHLITHVVDRSMPRDSDGPIADELAAAYPQTIRVPDFPGPTEAKSYISGLDLLIAARMHACIAAFSSGVPVLPVAYSRKFSGLFGELLGYPHTLPHTGMGEAEAAHFLLARIDQRETLAADVRSGSTRVNALLDGYVEALKELFTFVSTPVNR
jgi:colanic acid/amylovoran biosynthesis protein